MNKPTKISISAVLLAFLMISPAYATTTTIFPDADPESTSADGFAGIFLGPGVSFTVLRDHSGSNATADGASNGLFLRTHINTDEWDANRRSFYLFDSSSLPDDDTISSSTMEFTANSKIDDFSDSASLVGANPASNTDIISADYGTNKNFTTRFATDITVASVIADSSTYNAFTLNSNGLSNISKIGISKFGIKSSFDVDNSPPTWVSAKQTNVAIRTAENNAGTSTDPKLVIHHSEFAISISNGLFFGTNF